MNEFAKPTVEDVDTAMRAFGPYRLREGARHSLQDRDLRPGEVIELTAQHAASFGDRFEAVGEAGLRRRELAGGGPEPCAG